MLIFRAKMNKNISLLLFTLFIITGIIFLFGRKITNNPINQKPVITVSFYPMAYLVDRIVQDKAKIVQIIPQGTEPHEFEPTPKDITALYSSSIFIYNGGGIEPWVERIVPDLQKKGVKVINMSEYFDLIEKSGYKDPHIWTDPVNLIQETRIIEDALVNIDSINNDLYRTNANMLVNDLTLLDNKIKSGLTTCNKNEIVVSHDAFSYFAKRYNIKIIPISGISPEEEPTALKLAEIADIVRKKGIKFIFFETLTSPKLSDTIANETGVQTLVLNPLENLTENDVANNKNYITIMNENLNNIKMVLECK
jgi:zinc transport system substrate-binding protein